MRLVSMFILLTLSSMALSNSYDFKEAAFDREHIKKISVVAPYWEDYTNVDGTGLYWELMKAIYEPIGIKVKARNIPWNRAMKMVARYRTFNAIAGEYLETEEDLLFPNFPIDVEYMSVISLLDTGEFEDYYSLSNRKVGWIKGYDVIPEEDRDFRLKEFRDIDAGMKMLISGKIDFLIDESDEVEKALETSTLTEDDIHWGDLPSGTDVYMGFSNDNLSRELIDIYNQRVTELMRTGEIEAVYKKWKITMPDKLVELKN